MFKCVKKKKMKIVKMREMSDADEVMRRRGVVVDGGGGVVYERG